MSSWGIMLGLATSIFGGLIFLSIVSDDLQRANTDIENQRRRMQVKLKERLEYEAAVRKAQAKIKNSDDQPSTEALCDADGEAPGDGEDPGEVFTANPS